jgi:2-iminobutanoate/2-iminopropanoate deaminase
MKYISTDKAPKAIGAYSQAVKVGNMLFVSGQIPLDPVTGEIIDTGIKAQVNRCLYNLMAIAESAGYSMQDIAKVTIYTTDMDKFAEINEEYALFFGEHKPARAVVGVNRLPKGAGVEIEAVCIN